MIEKWRSVTGYEGLYEVSNFGKIRSLPKIKKNRHGWYTKMGVELKPWPVKSGHLLVGLYPQGGYKIKIFSVHRLVLEAFVGPCPKGMEACHFPDKDPSNNRLDNLRWDTRSANQTDSVKHGTKPQGTDHYRAKLKPEDIPDIRRRIARGESLSSIGRRYKIAAIAISCIRDGITWKHVN